MRSRRQRLTFLKQVHTFYGPQLLRPETTHADLRNAPNSISTGDVVENHSLYWHPAIYQHDKQTGTYTLSNVHVTQTYYRWGK